MDFEDSLRHLYPEHGHLFDFQSFSTMPDSYPNVLIEGLLRQGDILLAGGPPKRWKSWARLDMLYCIANGFDWLGFKCHKGLVVHFDLELLPADLRHRLELIHQSYCQEGFHGNFDNMLFNPLRGKPFTLDDVDKLPEGLAKYNLALFSLDPAYRLLTTSENDPATVNNLFNKFLALGSNLNCAIALLQHFSKGNQAQKDAQDRFSGSGVWSRFPDVGLTFTDHQDENCVTLEIFVRSFQSLNRSVLRWNFPRFKLEPSLDPDELKQPKSAGRKEKVSLEQFCALLSNGDTLSYSDLFAKAQTVFNMSEASFNRKLKSAKDSHAIYQSVADSNHGYGLTPSYINSHNSHNSHNSQNDSQNSL